MAVREKTSVSSFDVYVVVEELRQRLLGSKVDNIYQVGERLFLLRFRKPGQEPQELVVEAGRSMHTTNYKIKPPKKPPTFCMALRKHLVNSVLKDVVQRGFERIAELVFSARDGEYRLVAELFGRGNLILVSPEARILHALEYRRMRDRDVVRGAEFQYPPPASPTNPLEATPEILAKLREYGSLDLVRGVSRLLGLGGVYAEELVARSRLSRERKCGDLSDEELKSIYKALSSLRQDLSDPKPRLIYDGEKLVDAVPFPLKVYEEMRSEPKPSMCEALDEYFTPKFLETVAHAKAATVEKRVEELERVLAQQTESASKLEQEVARYYYLGELLQRKHPLVHQVLSLVKQLWRSRLSLQQAFEQAQNSAPDGVEVLSIEPAEKRLLLRVDGEEVWVELEKSVFENAGQYFEKAKQLKAKLDRLRRAIEETKERILQAAAEVEEAELPRVEKKRRRAWYEKFRWFFSSDGFLVVGGRDAVSNEVLVKKYAEEGDVVFHADIPGAPFVVVKLGGKPLSEDTAKEAAEFAASYSRAWREKLGAVDVYWVKPSQLSKEAPPGQYLSKGMFMVRGLRNYLRGVALSAAVGIERIEDGARVIGGPVSAVKKRAEAYVELIPGKTPSGRLAKEIRAKLCERAPRDLKELVKRLEIEEIQRFIPPGGGELRS